MHSQYIIMLYTSDGVLVSVISAGWLDLALTHSVLRLFHWQATGALSLIPSFTLSYLHITPVYVPILSVHWVYQLTGYKLSPMKWSNKGNVQKIDVLMYLNVRRLQAALGVQSMFLLTPVGGASIEWVNSIKRLQNILWLQQDCCCNKCGYDEGSL